ncbi:hypothetical protein HMPREF1325_0094 [Treponema socranskii subsp. socranskii VPI DR56BR1116 = ATCC 35536]|uniref:Uncharacterized protein n=1 Tax=Treponema socranskii subsp. socranskii VPI DR56BR1116 = ATCC 35536 TaxID=1125725 RepID=U1GTM6_TRESO|nr:hypothetical protein HMPREF1325_0094 [Treponema socranskii subsp. socranskii VPI DR56BR1116 = ATCC 35536]
MSPIKEKRVSVFQLSTYSSKSEQCAGFSCVSDNRKTACPFFDFRLKRANPSSAELATSAEREVPRATLQRARSAKFPAQDFRVSPMPRVPPFLFYYTLLS